jgi:hypothetical protein
MNIVMIKPTTCESSRSAKLTPETGQLNDQISEEDEAAADYQPCAQSVVADAQGEESGKDWFEKVDERRARS